MKFAVAVHGTRGDIEPCAAVGSELLSRGHEVRLAVPPNLVAFVEAAGLRSVVAYGVDSQKQLDADIFRNAWKIHNPLTAVREAKRYMAQGWAEMSTTLMSLTDGVDLILTSTSYQEVAANVAEYRGIPLAALHYFPARANSRIVPIHLPARVVQHGWSIIDWVHWRLVKEAEDTQRDELGMPRATTPAVRRIVESGALEIQAYDELLFPGLADEWDGKRHFVGAITMGLTTDTDGEVARWVRAGKPPIYFGFGSMPVESPCDTVAMISSVCEELGERALVCSGVSTVDGMGDADHLKVVRTVNHEEVFPLCRAVVHHGGAGTTAAGIRAGVPTLILWVAADQPIWANQVKLLKVGTAERLSRTTRHSLKAALQAVLAPQYAVRAREVAAQMTRPRVSVSAAADLLEAAVRTSCVRPSVR